MKPKNKPQKRLVNEKIEVTRGSDKATSVKSIPMNEVNDIINTPNMRYISGFRNRLVIKMMVYCGLRVGEVCDLKVENIDFKNKVCRITQGKTPAAVRPVPINLKGLDFELQTWIQRREKELPYNGRGDWLFPTSKGNRLDPAYVYGMVQRMAKRAKVKRKIHPHMFRHTGAIFMHKHGMPVSLLQAWLGHETPMMSLHYAKASGHDVVSFMEGLDFED